MGHHLFVSGLLEKLRRRQAAARLGATDDVARAGAIVVGPSEGGKTEALSALVDQWEGQTLRFTGALRSPSRVFQLVADEGVRWRSAVHDATRRSGHRVALVVDDADLLDEDAAAVIMALVVHDKVPTFLSAGRVAADRPRTEAITSLWKDGHLPRYDLRDFSQSDAAEYLRLALHEAGTCDRIGPGAFAALWRWSGGLPAAFVGAVEASLTQNLWTERSGVAMLRAEWALTPELRDRAAETLVNLHPSVARVVEVVSVATTPAERHSRGWLPISVLLDHCSLDDLVDAEGAGVIDVDRHHLRVRAPYLAWVAAQHVPRSRAGKVAESLRRALESVVLDGNGVDKATMVAADLVGEGFTPDAEVLSKGAAAALRRGDPEHAIAFATQASVLGVGADPELVVGASLHLGRLSTLRCAANTVGASGDSLGTHGRSAFDDTVEDLALMQSAGPDALRRLRSAPDTVLVDRLTDDARAGYWTALALGYACLIAGNVSEARQLIRLCRPHEPHDVLLAAYLDALEVTAARLNGELAAAAGLADDMIEKYRLENARTHGIVAMVAGVVYSDVGRTDDVGTCVGYIAEAFDGPMPAQLIDIVTNRTRAPSRRSEHSAGTQDRASRPDDAVWGVTALWRTVIAVDRAWALTIADEHNAAVEVLCDHVSESLAAGSYLLAAETSLLALRFGAEPTAAVPFEIRRQARRTTAALRFGRVVDYADALLDSDVSALDELSEAFEQEGDTLAAADVAAQAGRIRRAAGDLMLARRDEHRARRMAARHGCHVSPAVARLGTGSDLTRREQQIMALVAQGLSNKQIAASANVSVRTVEGHVLRICRKLDASSRQDAVHSWHHRR